MNDNKSCEYTRALSEHSDEKSQINDDSEMYYRHFTDKDIDDIVPGDAFVGLSKQMFRDSYSGQNCIGYTIVYGDEIAAVLVFIFTRPNVVDLVSIVSNIAKESPIEFHKTVLAILDLTIGFYKINRLQALVDVRFLKAKKWALQLGFDEEGIMRMLGPNGEDYFLMARIKR